MTRRNRNLILVSIDSLRADHCGHLGDGRGLTPTLDSFAEEGVDYQNAIVAGPQTFTSMPALFTGRHRPVVPLETFPGETHWQRRLAALAQYIEEAPSFPERLQRLGYSTAAISPNPWTSVATGFDRGFDHFVDLSTNGTDGKVHSVVSRLPGIDSEDRSVQLAVNMLTNSSFFTRWTDVLDEMVSLRRELTEPYFLWVFLLDTHFPFLPDRTHRVEQTLPGMYYSNYRAEKWMRGSDSDQEMPASVKAALGRGYRDTVRSVDTFLGHLESTLVADDPVVLVHSDHGESFGEHGNYGHHHRQPYEENVHVPFVVYNAGRDDTVTDPTSLTGVRDTVLTLARNDTYEPASIATDLVVSQGEYGRNRAIRGRRFKYIDTGDEQLLVDLETDPGERRDVSASHPDVLRSMLEKLETFDATNDETRAIHVATDELVSDAAHRV